MPSLSIGQTFSRTSNLIGTTLGSVGLFVLILQTVTIAVNILMRGQMVGALGGVEAMADPGVQLSVFQSGWYWATVVWSIAFAALVSAGSAAGMLKADRGESVSLGDCFAGGLPKMLPMMGLLILWLLGIYAGFVLLVVPGCILVAMWSVTVPALIAEDTGVIGAFGRSRALTKGSRWKIFLLLLIVALLMYAGFGVIVGLILGTQFAGFATAMYTSLSMQLLMGVLGGGVALVISALLVAIYSELVDLKGERTGGVFD